MCGLIGIAGGLEYRDEATLKRMLLLDYLRGVDSTGLAAVRNKDSEIKVVKAAVNPIDLFGYKNFDMVLTGATSKVLIGHNRAATLGKVNNVNAHPFHCGAVVGAHNGTLDRPSWTRLEEALGFETNVDSEAIIACIDAIGIEDTVSLMEEGRTSTTGAWALTWYDSRDDTMNFLRNPHRPLWRAWSKDTKKIFWASEWPMIRAALDLSSTGYETHVDDKGHSYYEFAENVHYSINATDLHDGKCDTTSFTRKEIKGREPAKYVPPATMGYQYGQQGGAYNAGTPPFNTTPQQKPTGSHSKTGNISSVVTSKVIDLFGKDTDPFAGFVDRVTFDEWTKYGCAWCQSPVDYTDTGVTVYEDFQHVLCSDCSHDAETSRVYATPTSIQHYLNKVG